MKQLVARHGAKDTTARHAAGAELEAMELRPSQYNPGHEIPEKSLAYRIAKYFFFNDYGTYGKHFDAAKWIDTRDKPPPQPELMQIGGVSDCGRQIQQPPIDVSGGRVRHRISGDARRDRPIRPTCRASTPIESPIKDSSPDVGNRQSRSRT